VISEEESLTPDEPNIGGAVKQEKQILFSGMESSASEKVIDGFKNQEEQMEIDQNLDTLEETAEALLNTNALKKMFAQSERSKKQKKAHTDKKPNKSLCRSRSFSDLEVHTVERPHSCSLCAKSFHLSGGLLNHMRIHTGEKPYICSICTKSFAQSGSLKGHMRVHTMEKPFSCSICARSFAQSGDLKAHIRVHTGEKPFTCSLCSKSYAQSGAFNAHKRVHTMEKPFSCSQCTKSFPSPGNLQSHMSVHCTEKPYSCSLSTKSFTRPRMRVHTSGKGFSCFVCSLCFSLKENLEKHLKVHF